MGETGRTDIQGDRTNGIVTLLCEIYRGQILSCPPGKSIPIPLKICYRRMGGITRITQTALNKMALHGGLLCLFFFFCFILRMGNDIVYDREKGMNGSAVGRVGVVT